ncbi:DUF4251 domain-containing protein [Niabella soli]|uniref:DUF4251 domain-containing protein n=1 Tax=Niabella soli DSM 19437 TaxID=929713 RepID=W0F0B4_9BACT|nr:DUF4251 domain-containing protein [Niabella soli]AHF14889.1 hypothetical protein NIASO_06395 [Niabella soli DSM 19437]
MKKANYLILPLLVVILFAAACASQKKAGNSTARMAAMMDDQRYTFVAQSVQPTEDARYNVRNLFPGGSNLYQLTSRYDLKITRDSVIAYLPFFGRAYTAPVDPTKGGIQFTSTKFNYKKTIRKGNYEIQIDLKDNNEVRSLYLTASPSGYASLRIINLNKTPIAYTGIIEDAR